MAVTVLDLNLTGIVTGGVLLGVGCAGGWTSHPISHSMVGQSRQKVPHLTTQITGSRQTGDTKRGRRYIFRLFDRRATSTFGRCVTSQGWYTNAGSACHGKRGSHRRGRWPLDYRGLGTVSLASISFVGVGPFGFRPGSFGQIVIV